MSEERKERRSRKARLSALYEYDYEQGKIKLKNKKCPRCGNVMAFHQTPVKRWACGSCSYTEYQR